ncbi:hypothetical protein EDD11_006441 [Mortierella claussenii]|nr:hypothetical protein EDD11_006441 [Mortierella claussenii]
MSKVEWLEEDEGPSPYFTTQLKDTLLDCIQSRISDAHRTSLDANLTLEEIEFSIDPMANRSPPSSNGLPYGFYKVFKTKIYRILVKLFNSAGQDHSLPGSHHKALTALIFKKVYKVFTKASTI